MSNGGHLVMVGGKSYTAYIKNDASGKRRGEEEGKKRGREGRKGWRDAVDFVEFVVFVDLIDLP